MFNALTDPSIIPLAAHFFFDDAFEPHDDDDNDYHANDFVKQIIRVIDRSASWVVFTAPLGGEQFGDSLVDKSTEKGLLQLTREMLNVQYVISTGVDILTYEISGIH